MKHLLTMALVLLLSTAVFAQFTTNAAIEHADYGLTVSFAGALDTVGGTTPTLTSAVFSIEDYDGGTNFSIFSHLASTVSVPKITATLYGSEDNDTYAAKNVLLTVDSLETYKWAAFTITGRAKFYKLVLANARLGSGSTFDIKLRFPLKDPAVKN